MDKMRQIETLYRGSGLQYLLDSAYKILNHPLIIFDTRYSLIAHTDVKIDDPHWNEITSEGFFSKKTQEFFAEEYFTDYAANVNKIKVLQSDKLNYARLLGYIYNSEHIKVAVLVMYYEKDIPLEKEIKAAYKKLLEITSEEIENDESYVEYGRTFHEEYITKLLDGAITDHLLYTPQIQILYDDFEAYLCVAVVDVRLNGIQRDRLEFFKNRLQSMCKSYKYAIYSDNIVIILSSKNKTAYERLFLDTFFDYFIQNNLYAGISGSFENIYDLRNHYENAVEALRNGLCSGSEKRVFLAL